MLTALAALRLLLGRCCYLESFALRLYLNAHHSEGVSAINAPCLALRKRWLRYDEVNAAFCWRQ